MWILATLTQTNELCNILDNIVWRIFYVSYYLNGVCVRCFITTLSSDNIFICFQYNTNYKCLMPCNVYGPNDNYNLQTSHFLYLIVASVLHQPHPSISKLLFSLSSVYFVLFSLRSALRLCLTLSLLRSPSILWWWWEVTIKMACRLITVSFLVITVPWIIFSKQVCTHLGLQLDGAHLQGQ